MSQCDDYDTELDRGIKTHDQQGQRFLLPQSFWGRLASYSKGMVANFPGGKTADGSLPPSAEVMNTYS